MLIDAAPALAEEMGEAAHFRLEGTVTIGHLAQVPFAHQHTLATSFQLTRQISTAA
jgi:hypothetical protein